ncbi:hypothetical protein Tco_0558414 [Tanacetum coccineum]
MMTISLGLAEKVVGPDLTDLEVTLLFLWGSSLDKVAKFHDNKSIYNFVNRLSEEKVLYSVEKQCFREAKLPTSSYVRAMIELRAEEELKDTIVDFGHVLNECPKKIVSNVVKNLNNPGQATRGVLVGPNVSFKSTLQIYRPVSNKNGASTSGKKKQAEVSRQEKGLTIDLKEKRLKGNFFLWMMKGRRYRMLFSTVNADSDSEVEEVFDKHTTFMASKGLKSGSDSGYGTNSLWKQRRKTKRVDDYDPYDDDLYDSHGMSDNLQAICDEFDITVCDRKKK